MRALADRAALDRDTADLMAAVPPLAGILRYGDVRGSDTTAVAQVLRGIVLRSAVGLPGAGVGADEETGASLAELVDGVNSALALLEDDDLTRAWREALRRVADGDRLPGTLAGRATRLLYDAGETDPSAAMSRALSPARSPSAAPPGSRASSAPAASCSSTTPTCSRSSTTGWTASPPTRSPTSSRCCAAPSPSSPPASAAASASGCARSLKGDQARV